MLQEFGLQHRRTSLKWYWINRMEKNPCI